MPSRRLSLCLALLSLSLSACDSPLCIYTPNGCQPGGGGGDLGSGNPASVPQPGAWVMQGEPSLVGMWPQGSTAHASTPVVLEFSESMAPETLLGAFEMVELDFGIPTPIIDPPPVLGDGRLVLIVPVVPLQAGSGYVVRLRGEALVTDLTGQELPRNVSADLGSFIVSVDGPATPRVLATWPSEGTINQGETTEITVVFDRPMDENTIDLSSWLVTVDGQEPPFNPAPVPHTIIGGPVPVPLTQAWRWRSLDGEGEAVSLGRDADVLLTLSPSGAEIADGVGEVLAESTLEFTTAPFGPPSAITRYVGAVAQDAIGLDDVNGVLPILTAEFDLMPTVDDALLIYLFGDAPTDAGGGPTRTMALFRELTLDGTANPVEIMPEILDLLAAPGSLDGRFGDGELEVAMAIKRAGVTSPVELLDTDAAEAGRQGVWFDMTPPVLEGFGQEGAELSIFSSDQRDFVLVGHADEEIRAVEVVSDLGGNGTLPSTVGSDEKGLFVAAPVLLDIIEATDLPLEFTVTVYDRALNASTSVIGLFTQLGASGPNPAAGSVLVEVFDSLTMAPLDGALVLAQSVDGGVVTDLGTAWTDAAGQASMPTAPSGETLITVDNLGYHLFSFQDVQADRLGVPLLMLGAPVASVEGEVTSSITVNLATHDNSIADTRLYKDSAPFFDVDACSFDPLNFEYECFFGPEAVRGGVLGAQVMLSVDGDVTAATFSAGAFLKAVDLRLPARALLPEEVEDKQIEVESFLSDMDPEEQALAVAEHGLDVSTLANFNSGAALLEPRITVEGNAPGHPRSAVIGLGITTELPGFPESWLVQAAYPGAADGVVDVGGDELGSWITSGTFDGDLLLRSELADDSGNRVGARPRLSLTDLSLLPPDAAQLLSPAPSSTVGGTFNLQVSDVILDAHARGGLVRVTITDDGGRDWTLWRPDPSGDPASVDFHVPDLASVGGTPPAEGNLSVSISTWAWPGFDGGNFLWSDLEREHDLYSHSLAFTLIQGP
ncbi:MAG TPA: Ig-like domain-containing protein [Planctomycetota bacterium]|nr:Ig-like domain-containing protein [Planctomycetota bacterium]